MILISVVSHEYQNFIYPHIAASPGTKVNTKLSAYYKTSQAARI